MGVGGLTGSSLVPAATRLAGFIAIGTNKFRTELAIPAATLSESGCFSIELMTGYSAGVTLALFFAGPSSATSSLLAYPPPTDPVRFLAVWVCRFVGPRVDALELGLDPWGSGPLCGCVT